MNDPYVYIIIANYNKPDLTINCVKSAMRIKYDNYKIIVVDNGSSDSSYEILREVFSNIEIIRFKERLGFTGAYNVGLRKAIENNADYAFVINNDTIIDRNCLAEGIKLMESNPRIGVCQPKLLFLEEPNIIDCTGEFVNPLLWHKERGKGEEDRGQYDDLTHIFSAKGAAMLIRKSVLDGVGLFDSQFFQNYEDIDLCWRARLAGHKVTYCPNSIVFHSKHAPTCSQFPKAIYFNSFKNHIRIMIKNYNFKNIIKFLPFVLIIDFIKCIILLIRGRSIFLKLFLKALLWNIIHISNSFACRKKIQTMREVTDETILRNMILSPQDIFRSKRLFLNLINKMARKWINL